MPGSSTTPGRSDLAMVRPKRVAFRARNSVGTRGLAFAAQWLAYALPYRRFVGVLTDANARLGADVDRYSFIVVDLHHLLLAGLPAHFESYMPSQAVPVSVGPSAEGTPSSRQWSKEGGDLSKRKWIQQFVNSAAALASRPAQRGSARRNNQCAPSRRSRSTSAATSSPRPHGHPQ